MLDGLHLTVLMGPLTVGAPPREVTDAIREVQVTEAAGQRGGFKLTLGLARNGVIERDLLPRGFFDPPTRMILLTTIQGSTQVLSDGVIVRHDVSQSGEAGGSTLSITGADVTQMMDQIDLSGLPMPAMPPFARVLFILARYAMYGVIPIVLPSIFVATPNPIEQIPSQQGTDFAYISSLADEAGYVFYVEPGPAPGTNTAYWGPDLKVSDPQKALSVNMGPSSNIDSLSLSFDGMRKTIYTVWIQNPETRVPIPIPIPDVNPLSPPLGPRPPIPLGFKQINRAQRPAGDDATSKLGPVPALVRGLARAAQSAHIISASGSVDVTRYGGLLKARRLVGVRGAGTRFDGHYYVRSVTTSLKRGSATQSFSLSRNAFDSFSSTVKV